MSDSSEAADTLPTVAIIGAGQLGYLLCEAARSLGIRTLVIASSPDEPALLAADESLVADLQQPDLAGRIAAKASAVTFEFEAVPDELLDALGKESINVYPSVAVMKLLKNKARQKQWLATQGFASADYLEISADEAVNGTFLADVEIPFVQKAQEGGYDGYGVQVIRTTDELEALWPVPSIIETYLDNMRELAVVAARSVDGEVQVYPPVELTMDHERNILDMVIAPASLDPAILIAAEDLARQIIDRLGTAGVFAVEMFLAGDRLLVNEISPRVHNSGHHTLDSCKVSQFEQHMRAVAGLPLAPIAGTAPTLMQNILYDDSLAPLVGKAPGLLPGTPEAVKVYWYGKKEGRPGRKMGHVTCAGAEPEQGHKQIAAALAGLVQQEGERVS